MINALKRMDKKFLIFAGLLIFIPILIIVFLAIIQSCGNRKTTYENYESKMISATEKYIKDSKKIPKKEGEILKVKLSTLVSKEYIKSTEKLLDDTTCDGFVLVRRNGASVEDSEGFLEYIVDLDCKSYSTIHLVDKLKEGIVTEGDGLYQDGDGYLFRGKNVKNHISFYGHDYLIMGIDKEGILKLVKAEPEMQNRIWDNKFNVEVNGFMGKTIYKDSSMLEYLLLDYLNDKSVSKGAKSSVVAYDVCVGKRNKDNLSIDATIDCSEKLEKQLISLVNISDYARASLDPDCINIASPACNNYNYLYDVVPSTWTLNTVTDNTYEVAALSDGMISFLSASTYYTYNFVIYIDGKNLYTSGNGSSTNPYIIDSEQ